MWGWVLFALLEYIKYKYYFEKTFENIPEYLPKFIKNKIKEFNEGSDIDDPVTKDIMIKMSYIQLKSFVLFSLVLTGLLLYL